MLSDGRVWFRDALDRHALAELDALCALKGAPGGRLKLTLAGREVLAPVNALADALLPGARPVRLVAFNKSDETNWALPWHQDRVIALKERIETPGYSNWTLKAGIWHAEPPIALLEGMLFARIHLDAATAANGPMQMALGTHELGKIAASDAARIAATHPIETCLAARGDVLFVHALTLHRSEVSRSGAPRRALRIDYCAGTLPAPLAWETDT